MKTVNKTFYVSENDFNLLKRNKDSNIVVRVKDESRCHGIENKAIHQITILYQEPEKKIEITENDFDEAFRDAFNLRGYSKDFFIELKKRFFDQ